MDSRLSALKLDCSGEPYGPQSSRLASSGAILSRQNPRYAPRTITVPRMPGRLRNTSRSLPRIIPKCARMKSRETSGKPL